MSHFTPISIEFRLLAAPTPLTCVSHPGFSLTPDSYTENN
ncbi:conserved hypothetical protein [Pseudomonas sp. P14-2025]